MHRFIEGNTFVLISTEWLLKVLASTTELAGEFLFSPQIPIEIQITQS